MIMKRDYRSSIIRRAFTIPEVLLSAFLLTAGILTVMSLFLSSHRNSVDTRNLIIAAGLAQEGAEVIRNVRDNNLAYRLANWTSGDNCQGSTNGNCDPYRFFPNGANARCIVNYDTILPSGNCGGGINSLLGFAGGSYQHGAATTTRFYRLIKIDRPPGDPLVRRVQSFVSWKSGGPGATLNGNGAVGNCTLATQCVYTELLLSAWK